MGSVNWDALGGGVLDDVLASESGDPDFGDRYEVREVLGRGGQGTVYRAWDRVIEREVAIKTLRDPGLPQRPLLEETRLLSRLAHPAIPQIYDRGVSPDGGAYAVIQFIQGRRLDQVLRLGEGSLMGRLRLFRGVAGAVAHAHLRGILHRDLKPENVMVTEAGEPYLVDWGLAANGGPRAVCGSPYFAAPEQLDNQPVDARVDVYALGVLLYFVLSGGQLPYSRSVTGFDEFQRQRAAIGRVRLRDRDPRLPPALERICETAMAPQPAARYQRVEDLLSDLDAFEAGRPLARDLPSLPWRGLAAVATAAVALGLGLVIGRFTASADAASHAGTAAQGPDTQAGPPRDPFGDLTGRPTPAIGGEGADGGTLVTAPVDGGEETTAVGPVGEDDPARAADGGDGPAPADAPAVNPVPDPLADLESLLPPPPPPRSVDGDVGSLLPTIDEVVPRADDQQGGPTSSDE